MNNIANLGWEKEFMKGLGVLSCPYHVIISKMLEKEHEFKLFGSLNKTCLNFIRIRIFPGSQSSWNSGAVLITAMTPCNLIHSIYNDKHDIQPANTRNNGAIASIPDD
nr:hypothetical protein [Lentibacillus halodurans]